MSLTVSSLQTLVNRYLHGDTSTNSVSATDRLGAITESVKQMYNDFGFNQTIKSYALDYFDSVNTYDITTVVPGFLEPTDLRRAPGDHMENFTRKSPRELLVGIDNVDQSGILHEPAFAIDFVDGRKILVVDHDSKYGFMMVNDCEATTSSNGTWVIDQVTSDATNLVLDQNEFKTGAASISFDITVAQSGNNKATIYNATLSAMDFTTVYNLGSLVFWAYLPSVVNFTSITAYWGDDASNYWTAAATTDITGNAWVIGWNRVGISWDGATKVGSPAITSVNYIKFDFNYGAGQANALQYRLDDIRMIRPETLTLYYNSWSVGTNSSGTTIYDFTSTTDIPFFSGQYDFFDICVAHRAAATLFRQMGLPMDANNEEALADREMNKLTNKFPTSRLTQTRNYKVKGLNFRKRKI